MLNRWIKPNKTLDEIIANHVLKKYFYTPWYTEVIVHSFMMHEDGSIEFNAEIRHETDDIDQVEFKRGFL